MTYVGTGCDCVVVFKQPISMPGLVIDRFVNEHI